MGAFIGVVLYILQNSLKFSMQSFLDQSFYLCSSNFIPSM
jgi:hypothetical protein